MKTSHGLTCAAIYGTDYKSLLEKTTILNNLIDLFEIRLDLMEQPNVAECINFIQKPLLFTNRPQWEGGEYTGSETKRLSLLYDAIEQGAEYIDIELKTDPALRQELLQISKQTETKVIVSNHNFNETPSTAILNDTLSLMIDSGADIGKIITTAHSPTDAARVLALLDTANDKNFQLTAFSMGEYGRISRFATLFLGGYMSYVSSDENQATAPGQFSARQLKDLIQQFTKKNEH